MQGYHITILGAGRVGQTLGRFWARVGHRIRHVICRTPTAATQAVAFIGAGEPMLYDHYLTAATPAPGEVIFLTTPDRAITATACQLAHHIEAWTGVTVLHCSGALSSTALAALQQQGAWVGSMHPLHAFGTPLLDPQALAGVYWCIEGSAPANTVARQLISDLHGHANEIPPASKILYHAAAAVTGNQITALMSLGFGLLEHCGIPPSQARAMLIRLSEGVLQHMKAEGEIAALAGPISRGDAETVARHVDTLRALPSIYLEVYRGLSRQLVHLAERKGSAPAEALAEITRLLQDEAKDAN